MTTLTSPTKDILEQICEKFYHRTSGTKLFPHIKITDIYERDVLNHVFSGNVEIDDVLYGFVIEDGNWNGTAVISWGLEEDIVPYEPPQNAGCKLTFIPKNDFLKLDSPEMYGIYLGWRKEKWFQDQVGKYHYDRHFQPGGKIESYYRDWADKKGMKIGIFEE